MEANRIGMSFTTGSTGGTYQHSHEHGSLYAKMITTPNSLILHGEECGQGWEANGGFDVRDRKSVV